MRGGPPGRFKVADTLFNGEAGTRRAEVRPAAVESCPLKVQYGGHQRLVGEGHGLPMIFETASAGSGCRSSEQGWWLL